MSIKMKNSEGEDRIPQRVLIDGMEQLIVPLTHLFKIFVQDYLHFSLI